MSIVDGSLRDLCSSLDEASAKSTDAKKAECVKRLVALGMKWKGSALTLQAGVIPQGIIDTAAEYGAPLTMRLCMKSLDMIATVRV